MNTENFDHMIQVIEELTALCRKHPENNSLKRELLRTEDDLNEMIKRQEMQIQQIISDEDLEFLWED